MLAVGIGPIGPFEGLIILAIVVLIFGVGKAMSAARLAEASASSARRPRIVTSRKR